MPLVLRLAALHSLFLGAFMILSPRTPFGWLGLDPPNYLVLWQVLGVIAVVYALGYGLAARDPLRHWPLVLMGLVVKVVGPIGLLWAAVQGRAPWVAGWMVMANDVIWWFPFGLILKRAAASQRALEDIVRSAAAAPSASTLAQYRTGRGEGLAELTQLSPVLLVFLRHAGCTFCREAVCDLARARTRLEQSGVRVVVVYQSSGAAMTRMLDASGLDDVGLIRDFDRRLYRAFGLRRGTLRQLLGPKVWWRGLWAGLIRGHGVGRPDADPFQMPGLFLLHNGRILRGYYHRSAADRPDYESFAAAGLRARASA